MWHRLLNVKCIKLLNPTIHKVNLAQNAHFYVPERPSSQLQITYDTKISYRVNISYVFNPEELFCDLSGEQNFQFTLKKYLVSNLPGWCGSCLTLWGVQTSLWLRKALDIFVISANQDFIALTTVLYLNSDLVPEPFARKQFSKYYQKLCKLALTDGCKIDIKMVHFNSLYWIWLLLLCLD